MINSIILQSGGLWDFDNPEMSAFTIEDVAHNLSNLCRFNGACDHFFSVAQHSVNVSWLVETKAALVHDAAEAFYGDMTTWLKKLCPDYRAQLERGEDAVADRLLVPRGMPAHIKAADYLALAVERRVLFRTVNFQSLDDGFHHIRNLTDEDISEAETVLDMSFMEPDVARRAFLMRWKELS